MSGVRHHILPRFLLKGFASRSKREQVFTWQYRKEEKPFEINIINVSVVKHFYGSEGEANADPEITKLEVKYSVLIDGLRQRSHQGEVVEVNESRIADFIAHLVIRTKHLRESLYESTDNLLLEFHKCFSNFNNIKKVILNKLKLEKPNTLLQLLLSKGPNFLDERELELKTIFESLILIINNELPKVVRETHNQALAENPAPEIRANIYRELQWFVYKSNIPLILGDTGCLFEISGSRRFKSFHDKEDKIKNVFLPIASNLLLIGTNSEISQINLKAINEAIAKCSREFFVCSEYSVDINNLLPLIGKESELMKQSELEQIISKYLNNI
ncbi:DUF4238 domain-containing protein [Mastigocladopsis repens]|uniref:DUF4238 domain-containing protein n=1 Tax=Mastigocladopsis repens TaxID=221287 RepID=UPI0002F7C394|nr:DUF4238 domain-containing protein [Mastigocladopsis repens]